MSFTSLLFGRASKVGVIFGVLYGLTARFAVEIPSGKTSGGFAVMTIGFLVLVPFVMGYLTVRPLSSPPWWYRVFAPWVPSIIVVLVSKGAFDSSKP